MKLVSKEILPIDARDKLVEKLGGIDNGICDLRAALEWAEAKCLELNKEKGKLEQYVAYAMDSPCHADILLKIAYESNKQ